MSHFRKSCIRDNTSGHVHFLTYSCFRRQPFLRGDRARQWTWDAIRRATERHNYEIMAFVIMPEHVHLLVAPQSEIYKISHLLFALKQPVTAKAMRYLASIDAPPEKQAPFWDIQPNGSAAFRFWQRGGGYDRNLWSEDEIFKTIRYIHANPVRRGLCEHPADWPWSSAKDYENDELRTA